MSKTSFKHNDVFIENITYISTIKIFVQTNSIYLIKIKQKFIMFRIRYQTCHVDQNGLCLGL